MKLETGNLKLGIVLVCALACGAAGAVTINHQLDDQRGSYVGATGEVVFVTDSLGSPLVVYDGSTTGGVRMASVRGAVMAVQRVAVTNDPAWIGWVTTGELAGTAIKLGIGEWLESPVMSGGISAVDYTGVSVAGACKANYLVYTNRIEDLVALPYSGTDARIRISVTSRPGVPGDTTVAQVVVTNLTVVSYSDPTLLDDDRIVGQFQLVDSPVTGLHAARLDTVLAAEARAKDYTDTQMAADAADYAKTVLAGEIVVGDGWSPTNIYAGARYQLLASGRRFPGTNVLEIAHNHAPLLTFSSVNGALVPSAYTISGTTISVEVPTNGVVAAPFAEYAYDLLDGNYHRVGTYTQSSYPASTDGQYLLEFEVPEVAGVFIRILQPLEPETATFAVDRVDLGTAGLVFTAVSNTTTYAATLRWDAVNKVFVVTEEEEER